MAPDYTEPHPNEAVPDTEREDRRLDRACFGLGAMLPLFAGGNVLLFLDPNLALVCFLIVEIGFLFTLYRFGAPARSMPSVPACIALTLFLMWWCGQVLFRASGVRAMPETFALLSAAALYLALSFRSLSRNQIAYFIVGLATGTMISTAYGQYQYWVMHPRIAPLFQEIYGRSPFLSINANFYNANCYAPFLAATLLLIFGLLLERNRDRIAILPLLAITPLLITLGLTGSRGTVGLLVFAIVGLAAIGVRSARARLITIAIISAVTLTAAWISSEWVDLPELWAQGFLGRVKLWQSAGAMIGDHWLLGVGVGRYAEYFPLYQVTDYFSRYPHSLGLSILAETGIVGLITILCFFFFAFINAVLPFASTRVGLRTCMIAAAILLFSHAMLDIDWHAPANPLLLLTLLALLRSFKSKEGSLCL